MELDDLKQAWTRLEARQDALDLRLLQADRDRVLHGARRSMRHGLAWVALELLAWIIFVAWAASFCVDHRHVPHLLVMGLVLHVYGIAAIWSCATQCFLIARIQQFDAPVLVQQRRMAQLRRFRFYSTLVLVLPWWCLWLVVTLVALQSFAGVDLYAVGQRWVWINLAFGALGICASLWMARRTANRPTRSAFMQRLVDDMSGRNLLRASQQLDEVARFEGTG